MGTTTERVRRPAYDRARMVAVLIDHQRMDGPPPFVGGCACGWHVLGASWAEHVADIYETRERLAHRSSPHG